MSMIFQKQIYNNLTELSGELPSIKEEIIENNNSSI